MKAILTFFLLALSLYATSQNNARTDYFVTYGQVWGFLKYYHPEPSQRDWDQVLLDDFADLENCKSTTELNEILAELIAVCGSYDGVKRFFEDSLTISGSFDWMETEFLSTMNKRYLVELRENKPTFVNKYIEAKIQDNPRIINENKFPDFEVNPALNFLSITRYWNIINYYFPYRNIIPNNWNEVYADYLTSFLDVESYDDYYIATRLLVSEIRDAHGFFSAKNASVVSSIPKFAPFFCESVEEGVFITGFHQRNLQEYKIQRMDKLVSIDGKSIAEKFEEIKTYTSSSNDYYLSKMTYYLRRTFSDTMVVVVERDGEFITDTLFTIPTYSSPKSALGKKNKIKKTAYSVKTDSISNKDFCYVDLGILRRSHINGKFKKTLKKVDHLVIDARNYPHWTLPKLSNLILNERRKFVKFQAINFDVPGTFLWKDGLTIGDGKRSYLGKVYILVDFHTMSQAEHTVMALQQHPNAVVIGGQTAGADGDISEIELPFGVRTVFSGIGVFYLDGTPTQQVGIRRDYEVVQSKKSLEDGTDTILDAAINLIRQ